MTANWRLPDPNASSPAAPLIVGAMLFMQMLDTSMVVIGIPAIARSLDQSPVLLSALVTAYLLSVAVLLPVGTWIADRFGARLVFMSAIAIFSAGAGLCGMSGTIEEMIFARILQGAGGAMMVPVGRLLVLRAVPRSGLIKAMSILTVPAVLGPVLGPLVGGAFVTYVSWRFIFFASIPIGIIGILLSASLLKEPPERYPRPFDWRGFLLIAAGLAGLILGLAGLGKAPLPTGAALALLASGVFASALYLKHARRAEHPILSLALFDVATFRAATLGGGFSRIGFGAMPFLLSILLQIGFGLSPLATGAITFASAAGALANKPFLQPLLKRAGFRRTLLITSILNAVFLFAYGMFSADLPYWYLVGMLFMGGFVRSLLFTSLNILSYVDIDKATMGQASALTSVSQQMTVGLGVGIAASIVDIGTQIRGGGAITPSDVTLAFVGVGLFSLLALLWYVRIPVGADREVRNSRSHGG